MFREATADMNNSTTVFRPHGIEGEGRPLFILAIVMFLTSTLSVAVRLVGKKLSKGGISKDDYVLIAALVSIRLSSAS